MSINVLPPGRAAIALGCCGASRREVIGSEPETIPPYTQDWSEPEGEERLWRAALRHLTPKPLAEEAPGDVLLFRMRAGAVAKHLGLQAVTGSEASFVHAYSGHGVVESALTPPWERRIVARFAFPERN